MMTLRLYQRVYFASLFRFNFFYTYPCYYFFYMEPQWEMAQLK